MKLVDRVLELFGRIGSERYLDLALTYLEQEWGRDSVMIYQFQQAYTVYRETENIRTSVDRAMTVLELRGQFHAYLDRSLDRWS